jgi:transporter family-2 protein
MDLLLSLVALAAGAGLAPQAAANGTLERVTGRPEWAALVNFTVGLVALLAWTAAMRLAWPGSAFARAPWWSWTGGLLGAFYVVAVAFLAPRLGVATTLAMAVAGQTLAALAVDRLGLVGAAARPVTAGRLLGGLLLVAGVVLVRRS